MIASTIFSVLSEGPIYGNNGSFGAPEKTFCISFSKARAKYCLSLHYNHDNSYCLLREKKSLSLKGIKKF